MSASSQSLRFIMSLTINSNRDAWSNTVNLDQTVPEKSDQGSHCLSFQHYILHTSPGSQLDFFSNFGINMFNRTLKIGCVAWQNLVKKSHNTVKI